MCRIKVTRGQQQLVFQPYGLTNLRRKKTGAVESATHNLGVEQLLYNRNQPSGFRHGGEFLVKLRDLLYVRRESASWN
jgi:hypothetical protein